VDGNREDGASGAGSGSLVSADSTMIGHSPYGIRLKFKGIIDEVAVYSRALTPEEIKAHYNAKRAGGSTKESASELINSVSTRIDALKRNNVDTSLIEEALNNAQDAYDSGNHDEAYELARSALKMADDAYEAQQHIESAQSEIDDAKSIGAEVKDAEAKLKEAKDALNKGNYEYAHDWADDASELVKHASIGSVQINDLKALATKYDQRTVVISGTIRDIETVYGEGYTFALDDGSGMISVAYQGSLGDIKDGDKVTASGIFEASTGTVVADNVQKSGVGGGGVPGFEVIFAIAGLLVAVYLLKRK
jgi:PGF-CTERM protein